MTVVLIDVIPWEFIWPEEPSQLGGELVLQCRTLEFKQRHVLNTQSHSEVNCSALYGKKETCYIHLHRNGSRKNWLTRKDPDAGKDWRQEEKRWQRMRWLDGITDSMQAFEQALRVGDGQGILSCCSLWGLRAQLSDGTELRSFGHRRLTESIIFIPICTSWNTLLLNIFFNQ